MPDKFLCGLDREFRQRSSSKETVLQRKDYFSNSKHFSTSILVSRNTQHAAKNRHWEFRVFLPRQKAKVQGRSPRQRLRRAINANKLRTATVLVALLGWYILYQIIRNAGSSPR